MKQLLISAMLLAMHTAQAQSYPPTNDNAIHRPVPARIPGRGLWGEVLAGYSNFGYLGQASLNYRWSNKFVSAAYYKSHICVLNDDKGLYFSSRSVDKHTTVVAFSMSAGILFPGRLCPSISCGISVQGFTYEHTTRDTHILSLPSVWATIIGDSYREEVLSTRSLIAVGAPVEFRLHLAQRHNIGFDPGIRVDVNTERVIVAAQLGIRFGRMSN